MNTALESRVLQNKATPTDCMRMSDFTNTGSVRVPQLVYTAVCVCSRPLLTVLARRLESRSVTECFSLGCNCKWKLNLRACKCKITDTVQKYDLHSKLGCSITLASLYNLPSQLWTSLFDPSIKALSELLLARLASTNPPHLQGREATVIYLHYLLTLCMEISSQRCSINALAAVIM